MTPITDPPSTPANPLIANQASRPPAAAEAPVASSQPSAPDNTLAELLDEPPARVWYRRTPVWSAALLVLLGIGGAWWWLARQAANAAPSYSTQAVARGNMTVTVTANGTIQPTRSINIGSELSGTVLKVNVYVNDLIKKGQVLVELDTAKLRDQVLRSQASLAAANAKVAQTAATLTEATATLKRLEEVSRLSAGKVPAKTELDTAQATLGRAVADDSSARAGVNDAKAALSTDQINLSKASITAPSDGVVLTRAVDPGNAVAASLQAVTLFTVAEDLARLRLWVYVDEADVGAVSVGQEATFTVSAYLSRPFPARITRVGFGSTITDNVVTYLTYLDVDNTDLSLRPGMTATATIVSAQRKDALLVPNAALRYSPSSVALDAKKGLASGLTFGPPKTESKRKSAADSASTASARQVWILPLDAKGLASTTGTPVAVSVLPGISDGHMTEIIGGDLKVGMQVITAQKIVASK